MLRYAGVDLLLEDPEGKVSAFLDRHLPLRVATIFGEASEAGDTANGSVPLLKWPATPPLKLNTLYWPTGATRWAYGVFLADHATKEAILEAVSGGDRVATFDDALLQICDGDYSGGLFSADEDGGWKLDSEGRPLFGARMWLLPPRPLSLIDGLDDESVWLIPLVDDRFYWQVKPTATDFDPGATWAETLTALASALGVDSIDASETTGFGTPEAEASGAFGENMPAATLADLLAAAIGCRCVRLPDGTVTLQTPQEAIDANNENLPTGGGGERWSRIAGGDFSTQSTASLLPSTIRVVFGDDPDGEEIAWSDLAEGGPDFDEEAGDLPTSTTVDVTLTFKIPEGRVESADEHDAAVALARSFYLWQNLRYDFAFAGVKKWEPTGFDDCWELTYHVGPEPLLQTRVYSLPPWFGLFDQTTEAANPIRLAMTEGTHAPDTEQDVNLCDNDFAELSPVQTKMARNDMGVTIPDNTKIYIALFAGKWRIIQARMCSDPA